MEWQWVLLIIIGSFLIVLTTGVPVAFAFMMLNLVGVVVYFSGVVGIKLLVDSVFERLASFSLLALPLFILMGQTMFRSGIALNMMDTLDKLLGRLPGRLGLLAVAGGSLFGTLTGSSMGSVAMLGQVLVPEMEKRGYAKPMSLGPILGSGGLAMMIPPSSMAIILGIIGLISVGKLLIGIIFPGLLMATLYATYIITRCYLQPSIAPAYAVPHVPLLEKLVATVRYILPLGFVIFMVTGLILLGVATPSEAATLGASSTFILAAAYRRLNWELVKNSFIATIEIAGMVFIIIGSATVFAQILATSGATKGLVELAIGLPIAPIAIVVAMMVIGILMGMFMDVTAIMMICLPMFVPVVKALGFDVVWFGILFLLNIEMATTSPPFGLTLFVMMGVAPPGTTMNDCYKAALPFLGCDLIAMALIIAFPTIALWLPSLMR